MAEADQKNKKIWHFLAGILIIFLPIVPLMYYRYFYTDFANNLWVIHYYARYFSVHHSFPLTIDSGNTLVGMTNPLFYGYLYYQIMGLLDLLVGGARRALLLCIVFLLFLIYAEYTRIFLHIFDRAGKYSFFFAHALTALMMWSTYTITKIYDDGARGEYFGILLLQVVIGSWILSLFQTDRWKMLMFWFLAGWNLLLICGTHPITAEVGGSLFAIIVLMTLPYLWNRITHHGMAAGIGVGLCVLILTGVSPWIYVVLHNASSTKIAANVLYTDIKAGPSNILNRILLFPFDIDSVYKGINDVVSPYLTLQINMPLMLLNLISFVMIIRSRKTVSAKKVIAGIIEAVTFVMFLFCSAGFMAEAVQKIFYSIQFTYRLITYVDLLALAGAVYCIYVLITEDNDHVRKIIFLAMYAAVIIAAHNVLIQWSQAYAIANYDVENISSERTPNDFYWGDDYSDTSVAVIAADAPSKVITVTVPLDGNKMAAGEAEFNITERTTVNTNISASPYNKVCLDGKRLNEKQLCRLSDGNYTYAFIADTPGSHTITYENEMPAEYMNLRILSYAAVIILGVMTMISVLICIIRSRYLRGKNESL